MNLRETISWLKTKIQSDLFPHLEENFKDPLTEEALAKVLNCHPDGSTG